MKLLFATNNPHKLQEVRSVLPEEVEVLSLTDLSLDVEIPETAPDLEGNALQKARFIHDLTGLDAFADDTGLEVSALHNEPGVYSARYAGEQGNSEANMEKLLTKLNGHTDRSARFRTVIALILNGEEHLFEGEIKGHILREKRGIAGFGYDPLFLPEGESRAFAEMTGAEKNAMSHRGRAIQKMASFLK